MIRLPRFTFALLAALLLVAGRGWSLSPIMDATPVTAGYNTLTKSFTTGSGTNQCVVIGAVASGSASYLSLASATFNGQNLTQEIRTVVHGSVYVDLDLWYLVGTSANTTANAVISWNQGGNAFGWWIAEYANVDQAAPFGTGNSSSVISSGSITTTVSSIYTNSMILLNGGSSNACTALSVDPSYTTRCDVNPYANTWISLADQTLTSYGTYTGVNGYTLSAGAVAVQQEIELNSSSPLFTPTPTVTPTASPANTSPFYLRDNPEIRLRRPDDDSCIQPIPCHLDYISPFQVYDPCAS